MKPTINKPDERRTLRKIDRFVNTLTQNAFVAAKRGGEKYIATVKSGIGVTSAPSFVGHEWQPLSEKWKALKKAHKNEFWIESGGILKAIQVNVIQKTMRFIQIFAGIQRPTNPQAFERAMRNEYGVPDENVPPRQLFIPAMDKLSARTGPGSRQLHKGSVIWQGFIQAATNARRRVYGR
jgi:hypothetical protein